MGYLVIRPHFTPEHSPAALRVVKPNYLLFCKCAVLSPHQGSLPMLFPLPKPFSSDPPPA